MVGRRREITGSRQRRGFCSGSQLSLKIKISIITGSFAGFFIAEEFPPADV
jgi:hypothetical protein